MTENERRAKEEFRELLARIKKQMLKEHSDRFKEHND